MKVSQFGPLLDSRLKCVSMSDSITNYTKERIVSPQALIDADTNIYIMAMGALLGWFVGKNLTDH